MNRRQMLKYGAGVLGLAGLGLGYRWREYALPPPSTHLRTPAAIAADFLATLDANLRARVQVDYDHPYRQYHNDGVWSKSAEAGVHLGDHKFSWEQRSLIVDLMHSGLSTSGQQILPRQMYLEDYGALYNNVVICGEPGTDQCQIIFTGIHLNLRIGGRNREGVAFGGPQVYGDQTGDKIPGLPNNVYRPQFAAATALFESFGQEQETAAVLSKSPIQTQIEVQGVGGEFSGLPVAEMSGEQQQLVEKIISLAFRTYPDNDVAYAWECLYANGGVSNMSMSYYEDSRYDESGGYQNFRIEGPSAVFYFQGFPHVHGFFNVAMDGESPLSVGDVVFTNDALLEGDALADFFEQAMQQQTGADFAYLAEDDAIGRLRPGIVRTGDIYNAESRQNEVVELSVQGRDFSGDFASKLAQRNVPVVADRTYRVATTKYIAEQQLLSAIGPAVRLREHGFLRHHVVSYAKGLRQG